MITLPERWISLASELEQWGIIYNPSSMSYDAYAETFSNSRKNLKWPELDAIIEDMRQCGYTSVLDIGCGNGRFLEQIMNCVPQGIHFDKLWIMNYLGIDSSAGMIAEAKKLHPGYTFSVSSMLDLSPISSSLSPFDTILLLASFHHLETRAERIQVLEDMKNLLSPWWAIYMTNWNLREQPKYESSHRWDGEFDIKIWEYSRYYHGFTTDELAELFDMTGWQIVENRVFEGGRNIYSKITL
jgi:SAM-dependent methyltransferase